MIVLILGLGSLVFGADLPASPLAFAVSVIPYSVAELSIGLLIAGLVSTAKGASIVGNILFFPSMFFAGVWTPGDLMPDAIRWVRDITPMGAGMTSMQDAWAGHWPGAAHLIALVAVAAACIGLAAKFFRWE
ncbi:ABC transporter permease [Kribbella qitaiheensis]|uniref:ABC transporter permease n=1 Tax=Kribbella qitaiheensis TaxID=1544730 RepID=UPI001FE4446E|nr:ABC transporter permease [Kribbella qitaiheensis]